MRYELMVGLRSTRARRRNRFISINSLFSMIGIAVGVWALIVVLSIMNGFQKDVRDRMLSVLSHIEVFDASGSLPDWKATAHEALQQRLTGARIDRLLSGLDALFKRARAAAGVDRGARIEDR